jgi:hypothetical protein
LATVVLDRSAGEKVASGTIDDVDLAVFVCKTDAAVSAQALGSYARHGVSAAMIVIVDIALVLMCNGRDVGRCLDKSVVAGT